MTNPDQTPAERAAQTMAERLAFVSAQLEVANREVMRLSDINQKLERENFTFRRKEFHARERC